MTVVSSSFCQLKFLRLLSVLRKPLSYDRHVYYIEVSNFTGELHSLKLDFPTPTWFSMIRDPVAKYISRFNYFRHNKFKEGLDSNLNPIPKSTNYTTFKRKNFEKCIMEGDVECTFFPGRKYDLTIVSGTKS